jgi:NADH:ubiquinone oxidoreductase subunit
MGVFKNIFTWWDGVGFGTWLGTKLHGERVGDDSLGNVYYTGGARTDGSPRRWVMYAGANDTSRIPAEWHSWLHGQIDDVPDKSLPPPRRWELESTPNLTGTDAAYLPSGALAAGGHRAAATGDYQAWSPDTE